MDSFNEYLTKFSSTTKGSEMKDSLYRCFNLLVSNLTTTNTILNYVEKKVKELERS